MQKEINILDIKQREKEIKANRKEIGVIIEALLFSTSEPLSLIKMKEIIEMTFPITSQELRSIIAELKEDYKKSRGFQLDDIAEGYLLRTRQDLFPYVEMLHRDRRGEKLSRAAHEVLAIIAFKQPITKVEIEQIRGVDSSGTLYSLMERGLVEVKGRLETLGRPCQYGLTKNFLKHFGLKDFHQLFQFFDNKQNVSQS